MFSFFCIIWQFQISVVKSFFIGEFIITFLKIGNQDYLCMVGNWIQRLFGILIYFAAWSRHINLKRLFNVVNAVHWGPWGCALGVMSTNIAGALCQRIKIQRYASNTKCSFGIVAEIRRESCVVIANMYTMCLIDFANLKLK